MTKTSNGLPLTIPLEIPAYWTPEQAFAVVELLDDLRDRIWAHYSAQLLDQYREQYGPADSHHTDDATGNPSPRIAMPLNKSRGLDRPLSSPAQASPSMRRFTQPVTSASPTMAYEKHFVADRKRLQQQTF